MSVEAQSWAYAVALPKQPCAKSVLVALANRADEDGYCWPGIADLERRTEFNRRTIQRAISLLIEQKLLLVSARYSNAGRQNTNLYRLAMGNVSPTISCGEGVVASPLRAAQRHGEGVVAPPPRAAQRHGEGVVAPPKSSSEQSVEQSEEKDCGAIAPTVVVVCKSAAVWEAYAEAYKQRYGTEPVRNRSVNAMLGKLIEKLGADESPPVAAFYVTHRSSWYAEKMHPVNLLLQDAEKLRTEWATGRQAVGRFDRPKAQLKSLVDLL